MEHICITTKKLIKDWRGKQHTNRERILEDSLQRVLTKQEQKHIRYYSIKDARVTLGVDSCAWLYMLNLKKRQLLRNLNQILQPKEEIVEILLHLVANQRHTS